MDTIISFDISAKCLVIEPNNKIFSMDIYFSTNLSEYITFGDIFKNMKQKYSCYNYLLKIAKSLYGNKIYYHAFFESVEKNSKKRYNKIASHIINNPYNSDCGKKYSAKCYGNCYILQFDNYQFYEIDADTFINDYNIVYTEIDFKDRKNRIQKHHGYKYKIEFSKPV